ncbi:MAG: hypothetical protein U0X39_15555 [Bacteroidales bacterium]
MNTKYSNIPISQSDSEDSQLMTAITAPNASTAPKALNLKTVLIITYYWPPSGGAGVQRWLKFAKYLPGHGWKPVVLTVDPLYAAYPVTDDTLARDIPETTEVIRTKAVDWFRLLKRGKSKVPTAGFANDSNDSLKNKIIRFTRGNLFIPDPRRGWNGYAYKEACRLIVKHDIKHVITTSPPHSTQLVGLRLKKRFPSIKWIVDLRDPWTDIYYYNKFYHTLPARLIDSCYEKTVLKKADRIITVGRTLEKSFIDKVPGIKGKTIVLTNGFDPDDFRTFQSKNPESLTIVYTGTLSEMYPVDGFLSAIAKRKSKGLATRFRMVGIIPVAIRQKITGILGNENCDFIGYCSHEDSLGFLEDASALLLIIPDHKSNGSIITGKLFEYLATGKPVICLGPAEGDASEILNETKQGKNFSYDDKDGIELYLENLPAGLVSGKMTAEKYSRNFLTGLLSEVLET